MRRVLVIAFSVNIKSTQYYSIYILPVDKEELIYISRKIKLILLVS